MNHIIGCYNIQIASDIEYMSHVSRCNDPRTQELQAQQNFIHDFERKQVAFSKSPAHMGR
mgnify:CR=1 FL=1